MKTWIMMRHGKSSWELNVSDKDRPLNQRGIDDAHKMGVFLAHQECTLRQFDAYTILTSPTIGWFSRME